MSGWLSPPHLQQEWMVSIPLLPVYESLLDIRGRPHMLFGHIYSYIMTPVDVRSITELRVLFLYSCEWDVTEMFIYFLRLLNLPGLGKDFCP